MFYVSRKVNKKYAVVDTSDNVEELYFKPELERIYNKGVDIKGVSYVRGQFIVTPVVVVKDYKTAAKNKVLTGTSTGYKGFDLDINTETGEVIAKSLTDDFKNYIISNAYKGRYILTIPDIVTQLGEDFLSTFPAIRETLHISVVLPKSLHTIHSGALTWWGISDITFNSVINYLVRGKSSGTLSVPMRSDKEITLPIKVIESNSLNLRGSKIVNLPYTEIIDECGVDCNNYGSNTIIRLGTKLSTLTNIAKSFDIRVRSTWDSPRVTFEPKDTQIMKHAVILDIPDDNIIEYILMTDRTITDMSYDNGTLPRCAYIFIVSAKAWVRLRRVNTVIESKCAIGILTYETKEGYDWLIDNIEYCCQHPRRSFTKRLDENSFGGITHLRIK